MGTRGDIGAHACKGMAGLSGFHEVFLVFYRFFNGFPGYFLGFCGGFLRFSWCFLGFCSFLTVFLGVFQRRVPTGFIQKTVAKGTWWLVPPPGSIPLPEEVVGWDKKQSVWTFPKKKVENLQKPKEHHRKP